MLHAFKLSMSKKAIVIGAGLGGLATAIRLKQKGYAVTIIEANTYAGGKLSQINFGGFRFDAGPSLFTMPHLVDELFTLCGKNPKDYFQYEQLSVICKYFYDDGSVINAHADAQVFALEMHRALGEKPEAILDYLNRSKAIYNITHKVFLERSLHKLKSYLHIDTLLSFLKIHKIDAMRSMNKANKSFFTNPKTVQFFNRYATYNGSNPYQAPATLNVIPHLENGFGAFFPKGGMHSITTALLQLAKDIGIEIQYNTKVEKILTQNDQVTGVQTSTITIEADVVVSNMDIYHTYTKLLSNHPAPKRIHTQERSSSALIFYWGIKQSFPSLLLHNIFFSNDYEAEFKAIFEQKSIYQDPTVYINISNKHSPTDAPEGCENWFVMINVPNNTNQNWDELITRAKQNIIEKINTSLHTDIESLIVSEQILDPRSIESKTSSYQGSLYGTSSNSKFAAFLRHPNFSSEIKNLYFAGGSVHPGGGIPLALLSGKIVADIMK